MDNAILRRRGEGFETSPAPNRNGSHEDHVMASKALPSPEGLRQLLRYEPEAGCIFWRERSSHHFGNLRACRTWNARYAGKAALISVKDNGYLYGRIFDKNYYAHRIAFYLAHGWMPEQIDHIDGDRKNNRLENLRHATPQANCRNLAARSDNTSGKNGVYLDRRDGVWFAQGGKKHLGRFKRFEDAVAARDVFETENGFSERHGKKKTTATTIARDKGLAERNAQ